MAFVSFPDRLIAIARELEIDSDVEFRFRNQSFHVHQPPWSLPIDSAIPPRERLLHAIALVLYYGAYCCNRQNGIYMVPEDLVPDPSFVNSLSQANQSRRTIEHGWRLIHREEDDTIHVAKAGRFRVAAAGQYQDAPQADPSSVDPMLFSLPLLREEREWLPMFYLAHSETLPNQCDDLDNVRFYFHCDQNSVLDVIRNVTESLNRHFVPFRLKCLDHPRLYGRSDALVLYVEKRYVQFVARCLISLTSEAAFQLHDGVPLFSKQLVKGIGIAEDPGDGQSFGQQRTRLLADALLAAHDSQCLHDQHVLTYVEKRFQDAGLDLQRPHINAGSVDWYDFPGQQAASR